VFSAGSGALDTELSAERPEQAELLIGTAGLVWRRFRHHRSGMMSLAFLVVMLFAGSSRR